LNLKFLSNLPVGFLSRYIITWKEGEMVREDLVIEIAVALPLACPICGTVIRLDRIRVEYFEPGKGWHLRGLCGRCDVGGMFLFDVEDPRYESARRAVLLDRSFEEEVRFRETGPIEPGYEVRLPSLLTDIWRAEPRDQTDPTRNT